VTSISIITPWYEHHELAADYVQAVVPELQDGDRAVVVDNGRAPNLPGVTVLNGHDNLGFVRGSNKGLRWAFTDAVLFLNNDIIYRRRGWLDEIRAALELGVLVGPLRNDLHAHVDGQPMPYLDGWCLAGMREDILDLGGFDEGLREPAYYSDNLLCLEARAAGMTLRDIRPGVVHKLNVTAGPASAPDVQAASAVNRARYIKRARALLVAA
jgi:GT2 family glycosyltransferase